MENSTHFNIVYHISSLRAKANANKLLNMHRLWGGKKKTQSINVMFRGETLT